MRSKTSTDSDKTGVPNLLLKIFTWYIHLKFAIVKTIMRRYKAKDGEVSHLKLASASRNKNDEGALEIGRIGGHQRKQ